MTLLPWHDQLLVRIDEDYDHDRASDRRSRYGVYLEQNADLFRDSWSDEPAPLDDPVEFAVHAWRVATGPVMSPGYVQRRPDLGGVELRRDEDDGSLLAIVQVPLRHAQIGGNAKRFPYTWQDWGQARAWASDDPHYPGLVPPESFKRPAVLATAEVIVPGHGWNGLITPSVYGGPKLVTEAKAVLEALVEQINVDAGPVVDKLLE